MVMTVGTRSCPAGRAIRTVKVKVDYNAKPDAIVLP